MARTIVVNFDGETSEFGLTRVQRDKIYGKKRRVVVDENGEDCVSASLTRDGATLLPSGSIASVYLNDQFEVCGRSDLVAVDTAGEEVATVDSTLGVETPLNGPIDPSRVLDFTSKAVYELDPQTLSEALAEGLEAGKIYETRFNYRKGFEDAPAFLLQNDEGIFALVGEDAEFDFLYPDVQDTFDDDEEDPFDDDDLDFSMF